MLTKSDKNKKVLLLVIIRGGIAMNNKDLDKCPYCGETEMCKGRQIGQATIIPMNSILRTRFSSSTYYM